MRGISYYVLLLMALFVLVWQSNVAGQEENPGPGAAFYRLAVDRAIASCEVKSAMRNSRSEAIRRTAALSCLKAAYLKRYKEDLVHAMMENGIGDQPHKIKVFINQKFFALIRPKDMDLQEAMVDR